MTIFAIAAASTLLIGSGLTLNANAMEPIQRSSAPPMTELGLNQEQSYLEDASVRYSEEVSDDANQPLEFQKSSDPKGFDLLNLSF
jgi:hypothetical protein